MVTIYMIGEHTTGSDGFLAKYESFNGNLYVNIFDKINYK